jgi:hypothetical protein
MNGRRVGDRHAILTADHAFPSKVNDCARVAPAALATSPLPRARWRNGWARLASFHHQVPTRIDRDFAISGQDMAAIVRFAIGSPELQECTLGQSLAVFVRSSDLARHCRHSTATITHHNAVHHPSPLTRPNQCRAGPA